jgi:hypothetical protein
MADNEKEIRIKYQDLVYQLCNIVDSIKGNNVRKGKGVTVDTVLPELKEILSRTTPNIEMKDSLQLADKVVKDVEREYACDIKLTKILYESIKKHWENK